MDLIMYFLYVEDIYKIEYRNKPIYVDAELEKRIEDNDLELSIN